MHDLLPPILTSFACTLLLTACTTNPAGTWELDRNRTTDGILNATASAIDEAAEQSGANADIPWWAMRAGKSLARSAVIKQVARMDMDLQLNEDLTARATGNIFDIAIDFAGTWTQYEDTIVLDLDETGGPGLIDTLTFNQWSQTLDVTVAGYDVGVVLRRER